jgi:hypothetical protein
LLKGIRWYWQSSGKFFIGWQRSLATLWQIPQMALAILANSTYLPESLWPEGIDYPPEQLSEGIE